LLETKVQKSWFAQGKSEMWTLLKQQSLVQTDSENENEQGAQQQQPDEQRQTAEPVRLETVHVSPQSAPIQPQQSTQSIQAHQSVHVPVQSQQSQPIKGQPSSQPSQSEPSNIPSLQSQIHANANSANQIFGESGNHTPPKRCKQTETEKESPIPSPTSRMSLDSPIVVGSNIGCCQPQIILPTSISPTVSTSRNDVVAQASYVSNSQGHTRAVSLDVRQGHTTQPQTVQSAPVTPRRKRVTEQEFPNDVSTPTNFYTHGIQTNNMNPTPLSSGSAAASPIESSFSSPVPSPTPFISSEVPQLPSTSRSHSGSNSRFDRKKVITQPHGGTNRQEQDPTRTGRNTLKTSTMTGHSSSDSS
jgi:hypothetical protein